MADKDKSTERRPRVNKPGEKFGDRGQAQPANPVTPPKRPAQSKPSSTKPQANRRPE